MKAKKFKLELKDRTKPGLIGILTDETDLKLSWLVNQSLQINLSRDDDLNWLSRELPNSLAFPVYSDKTSKYGPVRLLKNRSQEGLWIRGYKQVDYLFILMEEPAKDIISKLVDILQEIKGIRGVYALDSSPLEPWVE